MRSIKRTPVMLTENQIKYLMRFVREDSTQVLQDINVGEYQNLANVLYSAKYRFEEGKVA